MRLFLDKTHARGARICYPYVRLAFRRGECLYHRTLGVGLFGDSDDEYVKNKVPWKGTSSCWAAELMPTTTCMSKTSPPAKNIVPCFVNHSSFFFRFAALPLPAYIRVSLQVYPCMFPCVSLYPGTPYCCLS